MRSVDSPAGEQATPPRPGVSWIALALLVAALLTVTVGGLATHLGPRWARRLFFRAPAGVVLHHSASPGWLDGRPVNAERIAEWHENRGFSAQYRDHEFHLGYHYVILPDGTIQQGRPDWMLGAHARGYNDYLGICLVGNFDPESNPACTEQPCRPTEAQLEALVSLLRELMLKYGLDADDIYRHSDLGATVCPGERFPMQEVIRRLTKK